MPLLFDLISSRTGEKLPPLLELPDSAPEVLAELVDERLALGKLEHGSDFALVPLEESPAVSRLKRLRYVLGRLDEPTRKLYVLQQLLDGVVDCADQLFKPYEVVVISDVRQDLQQLVSHNRGKLPQYRPTIALRQPLGELVEFLQQLQPTPPQIAGHSVDQQ